MFDSAITRLTLTYLSILILVSAVISLNWFLVATTELDRGLRRQEAFVRDLPSGERIRPQPEIARERRQGLEEGRGRIISQIILTNTALVAAGTLGSYLLARKTLQPIKEAHDAQALFAADAAHELRTPLTALKSEIEVSLRNSKLTKDDAVDTLKSNLEEIADMQALTESLLTLSANENMDFENVVLDPLVKEVCDKLQSQAKRKKTKLVKNVETAIVRSSEEELKQLLLILIDNALKYSPEGSEVIVRGENKNNTYVLSIIDDGPGISVRDQRHIFDRFYRADQSRSTQNIKGHGLGLSIAKGIAQRLNTQLELKTTPGKGTTFYFSLPLAKKT